MEKNNFNPIGNRPLAPTIYDENITPLESMNKLAFKINELIGDDTNVKEVVDKLLDVYASHMKLHGGYCEELRCIAFENPISCGLTYTSSPIYTPVKIIKVGVYNVKGNVTFYQWQYKNENGLFVDLEAEGSNTPSCKVPVTFYKSGDKKEFRCKLQSDKYTYYTEAIVIEYLIPTGNIIQTKGGDVNTYEQNQLTFETDFPTDNDNVGWLWSNDNSNWNEYGIRDFSIKPYYYIDRGTKTNGVSVNDSDKIWWKYQFKVEGKGYFSNTLITNVTKVDYDCGSATFNGVANSNWDNTANMIQWYSYNEMYEANSLVDLHLSVNKPLNNSVITSMQWLKSSVFGNFGSKPVPTSLLTGATDKDENGTTNIKSNTYLSYRTLAFRLQVVVGNVKYYSDIVCVSAPLATVNIERSPNTSVGIGATVKATASFNSAVPDSYNINDVVWLVSRDKANWTVYTVYGASHNIITVKIYDDKLIHSDGYGVNGGDKMYIACKIGDKINNYGIVHINRS